MKKSRKQQEEERKKQLMSENEEPGILKRRTIKELIAPSGIDASKIDHLEIISNVKRYARSFFISTLPRMCTFPELFRDLYFFGDVNTSIYITPIAEARSQNELNKVINELETERIVAADRGNINRESTLTQKRFEAEQLRDEIAAGFNKMYEASVVATLFSYNLDDLDRLTKLLTTEMSKSLVISVSILNASNIAPDIVTSFISCNIGSVLIIDIPHISIPINNIHLLIFYTDIGIYAFFSSAIGIHTLTI